MGESKAESMAESKAESKAECAGAYFTVVHGVAYFTIRAKTQVARVHTAHDNSIPKKLFAYRPFPRYGWFSKPQGESRLYLPKPRFQLWEDVLSGDRNKWLNDNSSIPFLVNQNYFENEDLVSTVDVRVQSTVSWERSIKFMLTITLVRYVGNDFFDSVIVIVIVWVWLGFKARSHCTR